MRSSSEMKQLMERFMKEVFDNKNLDVADQMLAEDFVEHQVFPGTTPDKRGAIQALGMYFEASPDLRSEVHDILVSGDKAAIRATFHGTDTGGFAPGLEPTNKPYSMGSIDIVRVNEDGTFAEHWGIQDTMGAIAQLGLMPPSPSPA